MEQHERHQPPMERRGPMDKVVLKVEVVKPVPAPASMVRKPAPDPGTDYRFMMEPGPERDHRSMPKPDPERHDHDGGRDLNGWGGIGIE